MASGYHEEVAGAFRLLGDPRYGAAVAGDRKSKLEYLGLSVPQWRTRTKQGFSFYKLSLEDVLATWDTIWRESPYGEVLFAAIEYYRKAPKRRPPGFWEVVRHWIGRIDNWAHADSLAGLYSELLEADRDGVLPQLEAWNVSENEWERRISIVSLIHYSGKNAVFVPLDTVLPMVTNCLDDHRYYVQTAVGWVLREMGNVYPVEVRAYLMENASHIGAAALSRAIERRSAEEKAELRAIRGAQTKS